MLITDSQVHVWGANTAARPWPAGRDHEAQKPYPVTKDMLLFEMELAKVGPDRDRASDVGGRPQRPGLAAARPDPDRLAIMGRLDLEEPRDPRPDGRLERPAGHAGDADHLPPAQSPFLDRRTADWLWAARKPPGMPIMLLLPGSPDVVDRIAGRYSGLRLVLDRLGVDIAAEGSGGLRGAVACSRWPSTRTSR